MDGAFFFEGDGDFLEAVFITFLTHFFLLDENGITSALLLESVGFWLESTFRLSESGRWALVVVRSTFKVELA